MFRWGEPIKIIEQLQNIWFFKYVFRIQANLFLHETNKLSHSQFDSTEHNVTKQKLIWHSESDCGFLRQILWFLCFLLPASRSWSPYLAIPVHANVIIHHLQPAMHQFSPPHTLLSLWTSINSTMKIIIRSSLDSTHQSNPAFKNPTNEILRSNSSTSPFISTKRQFHTNPPQRKYARYVPCWGELSMKLLIRYSDRNIQCFYIQFVYFPSFAYWVSRIKKIGAKMKYEWSNFNCIITI